MEYVTQVEDAPDRIGAIVGRLEGAGAEVRSKVGRDMEATFDFLVAARGRYELGPVRRHVCRHDEGVGDCSSAVVEG